MNIPNGTKESNHPKRCLSKGYKTLTSIPDKNNNPINKGNNSLILSVLFNLIDVIYTKIN